MRIQFPLLYQNYEYIMINNSIADMLQPEDASSVLSPPACFPREQLQCLDTSSTSSSDTTPQCSGSNCPTIGPSSALTYYIAAGAASAVLLLLLLITAVALVMCLVMSRRMLKSETLQDNPTYESAGESMRVINVLVDGLCN